MSRTDMHSMLTRIEDIRVSLEEAVKSCQGNRDVLPNGREKTFWRQVGRQLDDAITEVDAALYAGYEQLNK